MNSRPFPMRHQINSAKFDGPEFRRQNYRGNPGYELRDGVGAGADIFCVGSGQRWTERSDESSPCPHDAAGKSGEAVRPLVYPRRGVGGSNAPGCQWVLFIVCFSIFRRLKKCSRVSRDDGVPRLSTFERMTWGLFQRRSKR